MTLDFDKLRDWQVNPAQVIFNALYNTGRALDISDTGTGKTYIACAVSKALGLPTLVVCPKISISNWKKVAAYFGDTISAVNYEQLRTGKTPYGNWQYPLPRGHKCPLTFKCEYCQCEVAEKNPGPCYCHHAGIHCVATRKTAWNYGKFRFAPQVRFLIFDEIHRCNGLDSLNADMLIGAARDNKMILGLSATAALSPFQMRALGYMLRLHNLYAGDGGLSFYEWLRRNGCGMIGTMPGYHWLVGVEKQQKVMRDIHKSIIPAQGVRVRTTDIPNFPARQIFCDEYDIADARKLDALYADVEGLAIVKRLRIRQQIELLKVPLAVELTNDYLQKGCSVALFCDFSATVDALREKLKTDCIIDGRPEHVKHREAMINSFQLNRQRVIIANSEAGGVSIGLEDWDGEHPRVGLVFPTDSAVRMRQVFGRLPRDGGKSKSIYRVLLAAKTVETKMARALQAKLNNLDSLNDSDLQAGIFNGNK